MIISLRVARAPMFFFSLKSEENHQNLFDVKNWFAVYLIQSTVRHFILFIIYYIYIIYNIPPLRINTPLIE